MFFTPDSSLFSLQLQASILLSYKGEQATQTRESRQTIQFQVPASLPNRRATMASSLAYALCIVLCICSLQTAVQAKREKLSLTVYVHETRAGPNISILAAAGTGQGNFSALGWGSLLVSENIVKQGPSADSAVLGISTGSGLLSTKGGVTDGGFQVINKIWFSPESKYNGSSITVLGTLAYPLPPWELTAIAGTGLFRGYYGYVLASTAPAVSPLFVYKFEFHLYRLW